MRTATDLRSKVLGSVLGIIAGVVVVMPSAWAQTPSFGVGAVVGDPTALTFESRFDPHDAFQVHLGWAVLPPYASRFSLNVDYVYHFVAVEPRWYRVGVFSPYLGIGGALRIWTPNDNVALGARVPLGISFVFRAVPIELFAEAGPGILVVPATVGFVELGVGGRVYF